MYHKTRIIVRLLYLIYVSLGSKPVDCYNFKKDGKWMKRDYQKKDFFLSLTQPITPSDGNCMFHSLADQLVRLDPGTPYDCHNPDQTITRICPLCNLNFKLKEV